MSLRIGLLGALLTVGLCSCASDMSSSPDTLGVRNGRLTECPSSPNCVHSADPDPARRVDALPATGPVEEVILRLVALVKTQPRTQIIQQRGAYLRAAFSSRVFGFVDDVEFLYLPEEGAVHLRSASRVGWWDLGANRRRAEQLRKDWLAQ